MVPELTKPPMDIVEGLSLGNVVDQKRAYSTSVVSTGDGSVPLLTGRVPYLCLDCFPLYLLQHDHYYQLEVLLMHDTYIYASKYNELYKLRACTHRTCM